MKMNSSGVSAKRRSPKGLLSGASGDTPVSEESEELDADEEEEALLLSLLLLLLLLLLLML